MTDWINGDGPDNDIVLSSRIRLARNIKGMPFPDQLDGQGAARVIDMIKEAIQHNPVLARILTLPFLRIFPLDARVLVEDHLISPALVERRKSSAVFIRKDCRVSIMVNEEDHIRMQVLLPGCSWRRAGTWRVKLTMFWKRALIMPSTRTWDILPPVHQYRYRYEGFGHGASSCAGATNQFNRFPRP